MGGPTDDRKNDHLDLCATDAVGFREATPLLECVRLVHQALPERALDEIDLGVRLLGKRLRAPIVVAGMTGGTPRARDVNRALAALAERRGYGFGLGSQRPMVEEPRLLETYAVRDVAPSALLLGNLGVMQARELTTARVARLVESVGADALCLHMNPAMELIQPGGDRDFRGGFETFRRLSAELPVPVVGKETGAGVSLETARKLYAAGVRVVDVSGAGGTSWVGVETLRSAGEARAVGELLWDWGIPTAAAVVFAGRAGLHAIATGGISTGLDVARALALGASAAGIARAAFMALEHGGEEGAEALFSRVEAELRAVMLLCGAADVAGLQRAPRVVSGALREWLELG